MNHLFSPWRMAYIKSDKTHEGCVFCIALDKDDSAENLIVHRGERAFAILNRFPYTSGHVMVLPYAHQPNLDALEPETRAEMMELTTQTTRVLTGMYRPQGFNIGINLGEAAGAGIEQHIHIHIVPRWVGDTNFMTAVGETRVLPEALGETWRRVRGAWTDT
jgi:ATP adenylyltransferase